MEKPKRWLTGDTKDNLQLIQKFHSRKNNFLYLFTVPVIYSIFIALTARKLSRFNNYMTKDFVDINKSNTTIDSAKHSLSNWTVYGLCVEFWKMCSEFTITTTETGKITVILTQSEK